MKGMADLFACGFGILLKQDFGTHQKTRAAEPALYRAFLHKCKGKHISDGFRNPFKGIHNGLIQFFQRGQARKPCFPVDLDHTGAAGSLTRTTIFNRSDMLFLPQKMK